ncbi:hypothetical protein M513_04197 [Trichuris suis]|uniref:Uncharacterized protein n=1 Tax=Trichuris suis TaxID=68888 RepID=A0A085MCR9_9BILA|nr:hypothetical protein M513_04197 [Trichuris suis]
MSSFHRKLIQEERQDKDATMEYLPTRTPPHYCPFSNPSPTQRELRRDNSWIPQAATSPAHTHLLPCLLPRHEPVNRPLAVPSTGHFRAHRVGQDSSTPTTSHYLFPLPYSTWGDITAVYAPHPVSTGQCSLPMSLSSVQCPSSTVQCSLTIARCPVSTVPCTHTGHTTYDTRHSTRDMRHTTHDMRHTTHDMRQATHVTCDTSDT